ncbi:trans-Golgi network integral membrane protein 1-like isoform X2 [Bacillus rossius redtenbacheri]|uniref:trans-Golgi network integral membrane protein 1-like isoform X2 n=1 Tax=Bacillus rossius redtenbacheri TaxID=93214 RepID=UPI002FDCEB90
MFIFLFVLQYTLTWLHAYPQGTNYVSPTMMFLDSLGADLKFRSNCNVNVSELQFLTPCNGQIPSFETSKFVFNSQIFLCMGVYGSLLQVCDLDNKSNNSGIKELLSSQETVTASGICKGLQSKLEFLDVSYTQTKDWVTLLKKNLQNATVCNRVCIDLSSDVNPLCSFIYKAAEIISSNGNKNGPPTIAGSSSSGSSAATAENNQQHSAKVPEESKKTNDNDHKKVPNDATGGLIQGTGKQDLNGHEDAANGDNTKTSELKRTEADTKQSMPGNTKTSEHTEPELKEPELKELELKEPEIKEPEIKEPEIKEPEIKEPEIKEPELKEPEVDIKTQSMSGNTKASEQKETEEDTKTQSMPGNAKASEQKDTEADTKTQPMPGKPNASEIKKTEAEAKIQSMSDNPQPTKPLGNGDANSVGNQQPPNSKGTSAANSPGIQSSVEAPGFDESANPQIELDGGESPAVDGSDIQQYPDTVGDSEMPPPPPGVDPVKEVPGDDSDKGVSAIDPSREVKTGQLPSDYVDAEDSHFFVYFVTMVVLCIIGYLAFHNKQKILALTLEGHSKRNSRRRHQSSTKYRKLDSNLEEAVTSSCKQSVTSVIY